MASLLKPPLTEQQYLLLERQAETRSEFHAGQMLAMAGGWLNHSLLANSMGALLRGQVPAGCRVVNAGLRIKIAALETYVYADCSVICGEPLFAGDQQDNVLNPVLVVEVLSPSTEGYDRGKKFELYRTLESLREYLLVHQDRRRVEHYAKQSDGSWLLREHSDAGVAVAIDSLGVRFSLSDLYASALNCD